MRVLVNYDKAESGYLSSLSFLLKKHNLTAFSTSQTCTLSELLSKATLAKAEAIILCNQETLLKLLPEDQQDITLDEYRGTRLNFSIPVFVVNSLKHIHSVPYGAWLLERDLGKLAFARQKAQGFSFIPLTKTSLFTEAFAFLKQSILIAWDIETATPKPSEKEQKERVKSGNLEGYPTYITCQSWSALSPSGEIRTYCLPFVNFNGDFWKEDKDYAEALLLMRSINALPIPKIMQNGMYDSFYGLIYNAPPEQFLLDTMGLAHSEYSELPKDLSFLASLHLYDYQYWKDESETSKKSWEQEKYWQYNAKDAWYTLRTCIEQLRTLPSYAKKNYGDQFKLVYPSLYCAFEGWRIDNKKREELRSKSFDKLQAALKNLQTMFADPSFNPGSWQQVEKYIYTVFGAKKPRIGKSKSCTDEKNLKEVATQHPILSLLVTEILEYKKAQKAIGTYFEFLQLNERLYYALDPFGTETSRFACRASSLWVGTQVQNIPGYAKYMLVFDEGMEGCEIDNSQSEARCTAYLAKEPNFIAALETPGKDFYRSLGTLLFQMPYEEVTDFFRNKVLKKINHGASYMMQEKTFLENVNEKVLLEAAALLGFVITDKPNIRIEKEKTLLQFGAYLLSLYHQPFQRLKKWYEETKQEVAATHKLRSPLGNVRYFFGDPNKDHKVFRSAVAHGPQNLSVALENKGFWRVYKEIVLPSKGEFRLKAQVHDSVAAQWPQGKKDIYLPKMVEALYNPVMVHGRELKIPLDAKIGTKSWKEMEEMKGLLGVYEIGKEK